MKNVNEEILAEIMTQFVRVVNKFNRFERIPMDFGIEEKLFPSEIHTIEAIGRKPVNLKMREVAQQIGMFVLILLMVFVFYNDIARMFTQ